MQQELISKNKMDKTISKIKNKLQNAQERMDLCEIKKKKQNPRHWRKVGKKENENEIKSE